jgi:hypothetical protein
MFCPPLHATLAVVLITHACIAIQKVDGGLRTTLTRRDGAVVPSLATEAPCSSSEQASPAQLLNVTNSTGTCLQADACSLCGTGLKKLQQRPPLLPRMQTL